MSHSTDFDYDKAFARNRGLVSSSEQARLKESCVALAGLGGVGGAHLHALVRMSHYAKRAGCPFRLTSPSPRIARLMQITGLGETLLAAS